MQRHGIAYQLTIIELTMFGNVAGDNMVVGSAALHSPIADKRTPLQTAQVLLVESKETPADATAAKSPVTAGGAAGGAAGGVVPAKMATSPAMGAVAAAAATVTTTTTPAGAVANCVGLGLWWKVRGSCSAGIPPPGRERLAWKPAIAAASTGADGGKECWIRSCSRQCQSRVAVLCPLHLSLCLSFFVSLGGKINCQSTTLSHLNRVRLAWTPGAAAAA